MRDKKKGIFFPRIQNKIFIYFNKIKRRRNLKQKKKENENTIFLIFKKEKKCEHECELLHFTCVIIP